MNAMDALTLGGVLIWAIFIVCPLYVICGTVILISRWLGRRREDREWAARVAERARETEMLERLYAADSAGERQ